MKPEAQSAWEKRKYLKRKAQGLCPACGAPSDGKTYCAACRQKKNAVARQRYSRRVSEKRCVRCGKALGSASARCYCFECGVKDAQRMREKYARLKREAEAKRDIRVT